MLAARSRRVVSSIAVAASLVAGSASADEPASSPPSEPAPEPAQEPAPEPAQDTQAKKDEPARAAARPPNHFPSYFTGGIAVAAAAVGAGFGISALSQVSDFDRNPTASSANKGEVTAFVADAMFAIALTFAVSSVVLFFSKDAAITARSNQHPGSVAF